jgi:hypothetical protein
LHAFLFDSSAVLASKWSQKSHKIRKNLLKNALFLALRFWIDFLLIFTDFRRFWRVRTLVLTGRGHTKLCFAKMRGFGPRARFPTDFWTILAPFGPQNAPKQSPKVTLEIYADSVCFYIDFGSNWVPFLAPEIR